MVNLDTEIMSKIKFQYHPNYRTYTWLIHEYTPGKPSADYALIQYKYIDNLVIRFIKAGTNCELPSWITAA